MDALPELDIQEDLELVVALVAVEASGELAGPKLVWRGFRRVSVVDEITAIGFVR